MATPSIITENRVILFTDVHNFSIVANTLAEQAYSFLQEMYERLGDIIVEHQGEIVKYMGDSILGVFPAGSEKEAVACSLKLRQTFASMVSRSGLPSDIELEVGLSSGKVVTGEFGHRSLRQREVLGEEVNHAATIGHHLGIAITEGIYNKIKLDRETRPLPDLPVKWQAEPLKVWEVVEV